jgi:cholest-4-en-3-one 26-monooxygenase
MTMIADIDLLDLDRFQRGEHDQMFARLRRDCPVYWHEHPQGAGFWNVTRHADVVAVNRSWQKFSAELGGVGILNPEEIDPTTTHRGGSMLGMDPPKHTRYRMLVSKGFTPRMVAMLEVALHERCRLIVDSVIERGECDFVVDIASELPLQTIAEIMGVPQHDRQKIFDWSNQIIGSTDPEYATGSPREASRELFAYASRLADERRAEPADDIITKLIEAEVDGSHLTELEFGAFIQLLAVAGNETTRNATNWGMYALMEDPDAYRALADHIDDDEYCDRAVEEVLRFASPVMQFRRTATEDTQIGDQTVRRGDKVVMWFASANRDEEVFDEPFRFDITRDPNPHVAFGGGGPHFCLGANLARIQLKLILREIVGRIPDMHRVGEIDRLRSNFVAGIKHMPVEFTPGARVRSGAHDAN